MRDSFQDRLQGLVRQVVNLRRIVNPPVALGPPLRPSENRPALLAVCTLRFKPFCRSIAPPSALLSHPPRRPNFITKQSRDILSCQEHRNSPRRDAIISNSWPPARRPR